MLLHPTTVTALQDYLLRDVRPRPAGMPVLLISSRGNASENDLRACVTKRRISGGTMSADGRQARDVMLGLMRTCRKLGISFFAYLDDRLGLQQSVGRIPFLPDLVTVRPV
ncbi:MAG: hypothetical protein JJU19_15635 [Pararhodobacter sp.]|nr:hypothetical protein [Pararhodobacter sp.]